MNLNWVSFGTKSKFIIIYPVHPLPHLIWLQSKVPYITCNLHFMHSPPLSVWSKLNLHAPSVSIWCSITYMIWRFCALSNTSDKKKLSILLSMMKLQVQTSLSILHPILVIDNARSYQNCYINFILFLLLNLYHNWFFNNWFSNLSIHRDSSIFQ